MADSTIRENIKSFINHLHPRIVEYKKNEIILRTNQDSREIGCVLEGTVYLCAEDQNYERNILCILREGNCFSKALLLPSDTAASYLITKYPTRIAYFQREELVNWHRKHPFETDDFVSLMRNQLEKDLLSQNYILHQKTLRRKLICYLKKESDDQNSRNLTIPIPFSDLADYLGVDRSALMKEIAKMKEEQLITGKNHGLTLHASLFHEDVS